jgi:hypothetical protein
MLFLFKQNNMTKTIIPINFLDLDYGGFHLLVKARINGKTARLVLDTGASKTVFDKTRYERFVKNAELHKNSELSAGLGTNQMETHTVFVDKLKFGNLTIENYEGVIMDLTHVNEAYQGRGERQIDGVLGSDILYKYNALIDYKAEELTLFF